MKSFWIAIALATLLSLAMPGKVTADGWSWGDWFGAGSKKSEKKKSTSSAPFLGSSKKPNPAHLTDSSKAFFAPVQGMKPQTSTKSKSFTGLQATRSRTKPAEKPPFWKSWFTKEEPKQPKTVGEWMAQPRVTP